MTLKRIIDEPKPGMPILIEEGSTWRPEYSVWEIVSCDEENIRIMKRSDNEKTAEIGRKTLYGNGRQAVWTHALPDVPEENLAEMYRVLRDSRYTHHAFLFEVGKRDAKGNAELELVTDGDAPEGEPGNAEDISSEIDDRLQPWGKRKEEPIPGFEHLSGRKILQAIGKDLRDALSRPSDSPPEGNDHGTDSGLFYELWMKDNEGVEFLSNQSVRYPFEGSIITDSGGEMWRIINPEAPEDNDPHPSERQDWPVTREIVAPHSKGVAYLHARIEEALASD